MQTFTVLGTGPAAYEQYLVPVLFRPLAEATISRVGADAGARVLDVACGTGVVARLAAAAGAHTVGLDANPAMLDLARTLESTVEWCTGDAGTLPFPDGSFDVAYCQQGLQFLPDAAGALREIRRVLAPDGRLAVSLWRELGRTPGFSAFVDILDRHAGTEVGDMLRGPFSLPDAPAVQELIETAGFTGQRLAIHIFPVRFASTTDFFQEEVAATPLAQPIGDLPEEIHQRMVDDLTGALREYLDDDGLVFPIESHIFTART